MESFDSDALTMFEGDYSDALIEQIARMHITPSVKNHGKYPLDILRRSNSIDEYSVVALEDIPAGSYLGDIQGERKYVWEIIPCKWTFFVDDECVIDMRATPRDINAYVREDFYEGLEPNCKLIRFNDNGYMHVGFRTIRNIYAGEELIYRRCQELWIEEELYQIEF